VWRPRWGLNVFELEDVMLGLWDWLRAQGDG
jgi:hypothetical protein